MGRSKVISVALLVAVAGCARFGWIGPQDLRVEVLEVSPGVPTRDGVPVTLKLNVDNRSGVSQTLKSLKVRFRINDEPPVEVESNTPRPLDATHPVEINLPVQLAYGAAGSNLKSMVRLSKSKYTLEGEASIDAVPSAVVIPFRKEGTIGLTGVD